MKKLVGFYYRCSFKACLCVFLLLIGLMVLSSSAFALQYGDFTYTESSGQITITKYTGSGGAVVIPSTIDGKPVVRIESNAFRNCTGLTSVIIPDSVTSIGIAAFVGCTSLTSVTIGTGVTSLGESAFYRCSSLTSIVVDTSNTAYSSQDGVLYNKTKTALIQYSGGKYGGFTIPDSVTGIGQMAFAYCSGLTSVTIPNSVTFIRNYAFENCTGLTSVTIPDSVTSIEKSVFQSCSRLTSVTIPDSVTSIKSYAFYNCSGLTSVTIGKSVTSIGIAAFWYCSGLTSIVVDASNTAYSSQDGVLYNKAKTALILYPCGKYGEFTIPSSVTSIYGYAFETCAGLTSVTIPESVTDIGTYAFAACSSLYKAYFLGNAPSVGSYIFSGCASNFSICYTAGATGFTTPTWFGYPAAVCGSSTTIPTTVPPTTTTTYIDTGACVMYQYVKPTPNNYLICADNIADYICDFAYGTFHPGGRCCSAENRYNLETYTPDVQQGCCTKNDTCISDVINMGYYATCLDYQCNEGNYACNNGTCETVTTTTIEQITTTTTTTTPPTIIELSSFTATPKASKIIIQWSTEAEIDNAGFNLYRAETEDGEYIKINDSLIPAQGSSMEGALYEFVDRNVKNRKTYYYKLEDIDMSGTSTMHGPVSATPRWLLGILSIFGK